MHRWTKTFIRAAGIALALVFAARSDAATDLEKQIKAQEQQLKKISNQIAESNKKLKAASTKEKNAINEISKLADQLAEAEQRLNVAVLKRNQIHAKLEETQTLIDSTNKKITGARKLLSDRMVAVYKYGGSAEFNLFMSASGAQDALATSYLLARLAEQDRMLITELSDQKHALDVALHELTRQRTELEQRNKELESQKKNIQKTTNERNKLLEQARKDKALYQAEQEELKRASDDLKNKVNQLIAQKKKQAQANKASQGASKNTAPAYHKGGKLAWPIRGKINSKFGSRIHPVFKTRTTHTGLDIKGNKGDPVRAAAPGEVLYTGWLRGYGQVVILDHGGNLTTVYAHLSGVDTSENARVNTGDQIGRVGSTGVATGNHLHFEVRVDGNATDPMKYLPQ